MQSESKGARFLAYLDFELEIGPGSGREYPVAVIRSPAGEARETMRFPFDELALENRLKDLQIGLLRSGGKRRQMLSSEQQAVQDFGRALLDALLTGYDNFNNPANNGDFDRSQWEICESHPGSTVAQQQSGVLAMTTKGATTGKLNTRLCARKYTNVRFAAPTFFEARIMLPDKQTGQIVIELPTSGGISSMCLYDYFYEGSEYLTLLHCSYVTPLNNSICIKGQVYQSWNLAQGSD
jgi:hypothetical protein